MSLEVLIIISNVKTSENYSARSYPDDDFDDDGTIERYETPVYWIYIKSRLGEKRWKGLRFMPYWNDPKNPDPRYRHRGWANSGLADAITRKVVTLYNRNYRVSNTPSPYDGAIQIRDSFLIHAGPSSLTESGWGAAGCVEIIGNFTQFKQDIRDLGDLATLNIDDAITELVKDRKLLVTVEKVIRPILKK